MYDDLTAAQKKILNSEQEKIVLAQEKYIVVSASPGCGKTYTLVKRIINDLQVDNSYKGFIACSFTREASKQLEDKLNAEIDLELSFVGTIDSFVLKEIIDPFKNRYLFHLKNIDEDSFIKELDIKMPPFNSKSSIITKQGKTHIECESYYNQWIRNLINGVYELSYCSYILAIEMIDKMPEVVDYITNRYSSIYIDEAQDLNEFQHDLIKCLKEKCDLRIVLIGDKNQSIYDFRGARPELFADLSNNEYTEYPISISVRCHKSIMDFTNNFLNPNFVMTENQSNNVYIYDDNKYEVLYKIISESDGKVLWLVDDNQFASDIFKVTTAKDWGFIYTKSLDLTDESFNGNYLQLLEEVLKFYYNFKNIIPEFSYSIDDIRNVVADYTVDKNINRVIRELKNVEIDVIEYVTKVFQCLEIVISQNLKKELAEKLNQEIYSKHYFKSDVLRRIMTIHSSKGLEAETVIVFVNYSDYWFGRNSERERDQKYRSYFVAFSRAEIGLHIFFKKTENKNGQNFNIIQNNIKDKIIACRDNVNNSLEK